MARILYNGRVKRLSRPTSMKEIRAANIENMIEMSNRNSEHYLLPDEQVNRAHMILSDKLNGAVRHMQAATVRYKGLYLGENYVYDVYDGTMSGVYNMKEEKVSEIDADKSQKIYMYKTDFTNMLTLFKDNRGFICPVSEFRASNKPINYTPYIPFPPNTKKQEYEDKVFINEVYWASQVDFDINKSSFVPTFAKYINNYNDDPINSITYTDNQKTYETVYRYGDCNKLKFIFEKGIGLVEGYHIMLDADRNIVNQKQLTGEDLERYDNVIKEAQKRLMTIINEQKGTQQDERKESPILRQLFLLISGIKKRAETDRRR